MERPDLPPASMGGITRMHDPSELVHDRIRRRVMHIALAFALILLAFDLYAFGARHRRAVFILSWLLASVPMSLFARLIELRYKMSRAELRLVLSEIPMRTWLSVAVYFTLWVVSVPFPFAKFFQPIANPAPVTGISVAWALFGACLADFFTYFRHRHERLRHLYMVTATLQDLRGFKKEILCPLIAIALQVLAIVV